MELKEKNTAASATVLQSSLLSLVMHRLKDRVLFPEKIEKATEYLKHASKK